jgi:hypothetical protein
MRVQRIPSHTGWQSGATLRFPGLAREVAMLIRITLPLLGLLVVSGCNRPVPPDPDKRPEPQATALRDAVQAPLEKAKAARETLEKAPDTRAADDPAIQP